MLTSVLRQFQQPVCLAFDFLLQELKPGTSSSLSVYLLSKQHFPTKLHVSQQTISSNGDWKRGSVYIPSGIYHVMFLATLGLPYHSDIFVDNIEVDEAHLCGGANIKPTGILFYFPIFSDIVYQIRTFYYQQKKLNMNKCRFCSIQEVIHKCSRGTQ